MMILDVDVIDNDDDDWFIDVVFWWRWFDIRYLLFFICWPIYDTIDQTRRFYYSNYMLSTKNLMMHLDIRWQKEAHLSSPYRTIPITQIATSSMINLSQLSMRPPHIVMWRLWVCHLVQTITPLQVYMTNLLTP